MKFSADALKGTRSIKAYLFRRIQRAACCLFAGAGAGGAGSCGLPTFPHPAGPRLAPLCAAPSGSVPAPLALAGPGARPALPDLAPCLLEAEPPPHHLREGKRAPESRFQRPRWGEATFKSSTIISLWAFWRTKRDYPLDGGEDSAGEQASDGNLAFTLQEIKGAHLCPVSFRDVQSHFHHAARPLPHGLWEGFADGNSSTLL